MNNLKLLRKRRNLSQQEVADAVNVARSTYTQYETGKRLPSIDVLTKLAEYFDSTVDYLLGREEEPEPIGKPVDPAEFPPQTLIRQPLPDPENETALIPILGSVRAGYDYIAEQEMLGWLKVEENFASLHRKAYALYVKGDSMAPEIHHNDIAICLPDQEIRDNDVAVVCVNGDEGTVKRVRFDADGLTLLPANPRYKPHHYSAEDVDTLPVILQAKVIEIRHVYK